MNKGRMKTYHYQSHLQLFCKRPNIIQENLTLARSNTDVVYQETLPPVHGGSQWHRVVIVCRFAHVQVPNTTQVARVKIVLVRIDFHARSVVAECHPGGKEVCAS